MRAAADRRHGHRAVWLAHLRCRRDRERADFCDGQHARQAPRGMLVHAWSRRTCLVRGL